MSVVLLSPRRTDFPDPLHAEPDGLLAVGGDLSLARLLSAYAKGIFPWYAEGSPILWWSPSPRLILEPKRLHVSASLRRFMNKNRFRVTLDRAFEQVIVSCATVMRPEGRGTWIVRDMIEAYCGLHQAGYAHSIEVWEGDRLAGGLYGVGLGRAFFGESMFHRRSNASKTAVVHLARWLGEWGYHFIDCQQTTPHMLRFGAREVSRKEFMERLERALAFPTDVGRWVPPDATRACF